MVVSFRIMGKLKAIWPDLVPELKAPSFIIVDSTDYDLVSKRDREMYVLYVCRPDEAYELMRQYATDFNNKELCEYVEARWKQRCSIVDCNTRSAE